MLSFKVTGTKQVISSLEREKENLISTIAQDILEVARSKTPIDKGQARRGWRLENLFREKRIVNRVPHIDALENGHSKQAPNGILGPTVREISRRRYR
jgi:hypothetical protein